MRRPWFAALLGSAVMPLSGAAECTVEKSSNEARIMAWFAGPLAFSPLGPAQLSTLAQLFTTSGRGSIGKGHTAGINGVTVGTLEASNGTMGVALDGKAYPHSFSGTLSAGSLTAKVDFTLSGFDLPLPEVTAPGMSLALPSSPTT